MRSVLAIALGALALAGCPISPDNFGDAGPDAGDGGALTDAGVVTDAGTPASGSVNVALIGASDSAGSVTDQIQNASWNGADLSGTTSYFDGTSYSVDLVASNAAYGSLEIQLIDLTAGSTGEVTQLLSWTAPVGFSVPDSWSCPGSSPICSPYVSLQSFDGTVLTGQFSAQLSAASSSSQNDNVSFSGGSFAVTLPH
ncbi:MAG: hypothetical protein ACYDCL_00140 [Myxococcales bacterium]